MKALPTPEECYQLGYISKTQGFKGDLIAFLDVDEPAAYGELDMVFVQQANQLTPYFIEAIDIKDKGFARLRLEGVDSEMMARSLVKAALYLPLELLPDLGPDHFYYHEIVGYAVVDLHLGALGHVQEVQDAGPNPLLIVEGERGEILIPLHDRFLHRLDKPARTLEVDLPEGLVELNA